MRITVIYKLQFSRQPFSQSMIPLVNIQAKNTYENYINGTNKSALSNYQKSPIYTYESPKNVNSPRAYQSTQSLQLQTNKKLPQTTQQSPKKTHEQYDIPQTCQSLLKAEELQEETPTQAKEAQGAPLELKSENVPHNLHGQIPTMKQDDFIKNGIIQEKNSKNRHSKAVSYSNIKSGPRQDVFGTILNLNMPNSASTGPEDNSSSLLFNSKRATKQIKTFKIDDLPTEKQSNFSGCCGFGTSKKITFNSKNQ